MHINQPLQRPPTAAFLPPVGVASNGVFAGLMLALAAGAYSNGVIQSTPLFPDWSELGSTPITAAVAIAIVVPVLLNCDVCHQSLHPLMPLLQVRQIWLLSQPHCRLFSQSPAATACALAWHFPEHAQSLVYVNQSWRIGACVAALRHLTCLLL
jgi:hypothetical protein